LEGELETAKTAAKLDEAAGVIRARLAKGLAVQMVDPGATAISLIVGAPSESIAAWSALLGSLALELAGMIAMIRAESRPTIVDAARANGSFMFEQKMGEVPQAALSRDRQGTIGEIEVINPAKPAAAVADADAYLVGRFMLACLQKAPGGETAGGAIYLRYQRWCGEQEPPLAPLDLKLFAKQFAERCARVGIRTRRDGRRVYCVGVALVV
jgi:hypothetical protein